MRGFVSTFGPSSSNGSAKAQVTGRRRQAQASRRRFRTHISTKFVHGEVILHVKPPLTWLSHWRLSRKTGPLSWNRLRGREKATDRRARAALHARGGGPILEDEEIRALRMRRRDGLPDQANRRHVNGGLTWRGDFREGGFCDRKRVPRTHLPVLESRRLGVLRDAGSLPHVTGSDAGRARFALPPAGLFSTRCLPRRSLARPWRCRRPLATSRSQFSARRRAALSRRVCNLHSAQRSIYFTLPDRRPNPKR